MIVTSRPIAAPVALLEKTKQDGQMLRILVLQHGLVPKPVTALLGKLLAHV